MRNKQKRRTGWGYFLKEGVKSVFVHGFSSFAAIAIVVGCLLIIGSFALLLFNVDALISQLEEENEILAYVDEDLNDAEARSVGSKINLIENVEQSIFVSKEEAMDDFVSQMDDKSLFDGMDSGVLRHRYRILLTDISQMETTVEQIKNVQGIAKVNAYMDLAKGFSTVRMAIRIIAAAISAMLFVVSAFIISNTVKLATFNRREEIAIMKMVGATDSFVRRPFIIQGIILGLSGAIIAFVLQGLLYGLVVDAISKAESMKIFTMLGFEQVWGYIAAAFAAVGFIVGIFGSSITIRKYLKV